jgi:inosose dehydratase
MDTWLMERSTTAFEAQSSGPAADRKTAIRVGAAPVSWGIFELGTDVAPPAPASIFADMKACGYSGTESGPPGYLGDAVAAHDLLQDQNLALAGVFIPYPFSLGRLSDENRQHLKGALDFLDRAAPDGDRPVVLLSDGFLDPKRMAVAGRVEENADTWLDESGWQRLTGAVNAAAETCRDAGFDVAFHYHTGSHVESPREIERLVEGIDTALLGLCLDTGHSFFGGGYPVNLLNDHAALVKHVHLKDVNLEVLEQIRREKRGLEDVWNRNAFCELGTGDVDLDGCLALLDEHDYCGWIIVEHDRFLQPSDTRTVLKQSACRARSYLRDRGF